MIHSKLCDGCFKHFSQEGLEKIGKAARIMKSCP